MLRKRRNNSRISSHTQNTYDHDKYENDIPIALVLLSLVTISNENVTRNDGKTKFRDFCSISKEIHDCFRTTLVQIHTSFSPA